MGKKIDLQKSKFDKNNYSKVIDNSFNELGVVTPLNEIEAQPTIEEFFETYNELFYQIPQRGEINSHEYLIKQSKEYINFEENLEEIEALRTEIFNLRTENLNLRISNLKENNSEENVQKEILNLEEELKNLS